MSAADTTRADLLRETAVTAGQQWFATWREDLRRAGRALEGGWPGTMPEARALVAKSIGPTLTRRRMAAVTIEELGWASRATYEEARRAWLTSGKKAPVAHATDSRSSTGTV